MGQKLETLDDLAEHAADIQRVKADKRDADPEIARRSEAKRIADLEKGKLGGWVDENGNLIAEDDDD